MRRGCIGGFQGLAGGFLPAGRRQALLIAALLLLAGCAETVYVYKMYGGPERPESELALIELRDASAATVGDRSISHGDYGQLALLPGTYPIRWGCLYGVSVTVEPTGWAVGEGSGEVLLEAGHRYSMHCDRTTGPGYETFQWLKDETTGEVVAGVRKP